MRGCRCAPLLLAAALAAGCGARERRPATGATGASLPASVLADTAVPLTLPGARAPAPPAHGARFSLVRIAPARSALDLPPPAAPPAAPPAGGAPAAGADEALRPPIARGLAVLHLRGARPGWVELDVRVDAGGRVTDARPAAGEADSATVAEAVRAARAMRYLPALLGGRPVAVWCRQRLEISR